MWKSVFFLSSASVLLHFTAAAGGAESLPFPGYLPSDLILARAPEADDNPNDVYQHLPVRRPVLQEDQVVIYPHHFGFEYGQDPEHKIYEVHSAKELAAQHKHEKNCKHDKHGKHAHDSHSHNDNHDHHKHSGENEGSPKSLNSAAPVAQPSSSGFPPKTPPRSYPSPPPRPYPGHPSPNSISHGGYGAPPPPYPYQARPKPVFPPRG